jgi:putative DNA primase/helicase
LAVKNGVINLRTGIFRPAVAEDYLRRKANVEYSEMAECTTWKTFMRSITCEDRELYKYIRRALGYTLFGNANLQLFFLAIGSGGNGKGTLMRTVQKIMGDYATSVAPNLLTSAYSGNVNGPTPALAKLYGARMVVCSELPTGRKLDDAFIKQYAGGDEITARATYGDVFSFTPEGKLWLSANEPPEIRANDEAMWRRVKPIPFNAKFEGGRRDDDIEKKFIAEYPGILMWLVRGAQDYAASGLGTCSAVERLETRMQQDADSILAWLSERCVQKVDSETQSSSAYDDYLDFMRKIRRKALSPSAFRTGLEYKGVHHKRKKNGNYYKGFCIQER